MPIDYQAAEITNKIFQHMYKNQKVEEIVQKQFIEQMQFPDPNAKKENFTVRIKLKTEHGNICYENVTEKPFVRISEGIFNIQIVHQAKTTIEYWLSVSDVEMVQIYSDKQE